MAVKKPDPDVMHEVLVRRADGHETVIREPAPDAGKAKAAVADRHVDHRHEVVDVATWPETVG